MIFETWAFTKKCLPKNIWAVRNLIWYFIILKNSKCFEMKGENAQKLVMLFASAQGCQSAKLAKMRNCCPWFQFVLLPLVNNLSIKKIIYITIHFFFQINKLSNFSLLWDEWKLRNANFLENVFVIVLILADSQFSLAN